MERLKTSALFPITAARTQSRRKSPLMIMAKLVVTKGAKAGDILFMKFGNPPG